ncbi:hypothetical protein SynBIOSU31_01134 [Synechococcus sp. BIOS-U3-1]|nr:hypothetical protein SynBIOSU31_01134 [Synechococcus sp. BIOS-U3-1]
MFEFRAFTGQKDSSGLSSTDHTSSAQRSSFVEEDIQTSSMIKIRD